MKTFNVLIEMSNIYHIEAKNKKEAIKKFTNWLENEVDYANLNPMVMDVFTNAKISIDKRSEAIN